MNEVLSLPLALGLTLSVEVPLAAALGLRTRRALAAVALASIVTNPLLNYAALVAARFALATSLASFWPWLLAGEAVVVIVEWRLLVWVLGGDRLRLLLVSLAINAASALAGLAFWL